MGEVSAFWGSEPARAEDYAVVVRKAGGEVIAVKVVLVIVGCLLVISASAQGLIANPGFEDPGGWSKGWTIENTAGKDAPYVYHLSGIGGGHGKAKPRSGDNAIEIYSSDRVTRLSQPVTLEAGKYRLAAWARNNGGTIDPQLRLLLGEQSVTVPVLSDRYREYLSLIHI